MIEFLGLKYILKYLYWYWHQLKPIHKFWHIRNQKKIHYCASLAYLKSGIHCAISRLTLTVVVECQHTLCDWIVYDAWPLCIAIYVLILYEWSEDGLQQMSIKFSSKSLSLLHTYIAMPANTTSSRIITNILISWRFTSRPISFPFVRVRGWGVQIKKALKLGILLLSGCVCSCETKNQTRLKSTVSNRSREAGWAMGSLLVHWTTNENSSINQWKVIQCMHGFTIH